MTMAMTRMLMMAESYADCPRNHSQHPRHCARHRSQVRGRVRRTPRTGAGWPRRRGKCGPGGTCSRVRSYGRGTVSSSGRSEHTGNTQHFKAENRILCCSENQLANANWRMPHNPVSADGTSHSSPKKTETNHGCTDTRRNTREETHTHTHTYIEHMHLIVRL